MSCNERPKVLGQKCLGHGISPTANTAAILVPHYGRVRPLPIYRVEKLGKVDLSTQSLTSSTDQNRRYQTILDGLDVRDPPNLLPFDFFNTIDTKRTSSAAQACAQAACARDVPGQAPS